MVAKRHFKINVLIFIHLSFILFVCFEATVVGAKREHNRNAFKEFQDADRKPDFSTKALNTKSKPPSSHKVHNSVHAEARDAYATNEKRLMTDTVKGDTRSTDNEQNKLLEMDNSPENDIKTNSKQPFLELDDIPQNQGASNQKEKRLDYKETSNDPDESGYLTNYLNSLDYGNVLESNNKIDDQSNYVFGTTSSWMDTNDTQAIDFDPGDTIMRKDVQQSMTDSDQISNVKSISQRKTLDELGNKKRVISEPSKSKAAKDMSRITAYDKHLVASENELKDNNGAFKLNDTRLDIDDMNKIYDAFSSLMKASPVIGHQINPDLNPRKNEAIPTRFKNQTDKSAAEEFGGVSTPHGTDTKMDKVCASSAGLISSHPFIVGFGLALFLIFIILLLICMYCLGKRSVETSSKYLELDQSEKGLEKKDSKMGTSKLLRDSSRADSNGQVSSNTDDTSGTEMENSTNISRGKNLTPTAMLKELSRVIGTSESLSSLSKIKHNKRETNIFKWMDNSVSGILPTNGQEEEYLSPDTTSLDEHLRSQNKLHRDPTSKKVTTSRSQTVPKSVDSSDISIPQEIASNKKLHNQIPTTTTVENNHQTVESTVMNVSLRPSNKTTAEERLSKNNLPGNHTYEQTGPRRKATGLAMYQTSKLPQESDKMSLSEIPTLNGRTSNKDILGNKTPMSKTKLEKKPSVLKKMYHQISRTPPVPHDFQVNKSISKERASSEKLLGDQTSEKTKTSRSRLSQNGNMGSSHKPKTEERMSNKKLPGDQISVGHKAVKKSSSSKRMYRSFSKPPENNSSEDSSSKPIAEEKISSSQSSESQTSVGAKGKSKSNIFQRMYHRVTGLSQTEFSRNETDIETRSSASHTQSEDSGFHKSLSKALKWKNASKDKRLAKTDREASISSELKSILSEAEWSSEGNAQVEKSENLVNRVAKPGDCPKIDDLLTGVEWGRLAYRPYDMSNMTNDGIHESENSGDDTKMPSNEKYSDVFFKDDSSTYSLQEQIEESISQAEIRSLPPKPLLKHEWQKKTACKFFGSIMK